MKLSMSRIVAWMVLLGLSQLLVSASGASPRATLKGFEVTAGLPPSPWSDPEADPTMALNSDGTFGMDQVVWMRRLMIPCGRCRRTRALI